MVIEAGSDAPVTGAEGSAVCSLSSPSVYEDAQREADRHKWIVSEQLGHDAGERAIDEWYRLHWTRYCRHRHIEHLDGQRLWREFGPDEFGQLAPLIRANDLLVDRILDRVFEGYENLDIIQWAMNWNLPMDRVLDILTTLNVNRARLEPIPAW